MTDHNNQHHKSQLQTLNAHLSSSSSSSAANILQWTTWRKKNAFNWNLTLMKNHKPEYFKEKMFLFLINTYHKHKPHNKCCLFQISCEYFFRTYLMNNFAQRNIHYEIFLSLYISYSLCSCILYMYESLLHLNSK